jgi:hypothetical protein
MPITAIQTIPAMISIRLTWYHSRFHLWLSCALTLPLRIPCKYHSRFHLWLSRALTLLLGIPCRPSCSLSEGTRLTPAETRSCTTPTHPTTTTRTGCCAQGTRNSWRRRLKRLPLRWELPLPSQTVALHSCLIVYRHYCYRIFWGPQPVNIALVFTVRMWYESRLTTFVPPWNRGTNHG